VDARSARPPGSTPSDSGRHALGSRLAADLVDGFEVTRDDVVVEVGAGAGRLTRELARAAGLVLAIEVDPRLAERLLRAAASWPSVYVHPGDALDARWPASRFRVVGNIPFGITTALIRRIVADEHAWRLDLLVQMEAARKRATARGSVLSVLWATSWTFEVRRRIPARSFHPSPSVAAAWLVGVRRRRPLISTADRASFERLVRRCFERAGEPVSRTLRLSRSTWQEAEVDPSARAVDLTVERWVSLHRAMWRGASGGSHQPERGSKRG
jgi:23S rRNA (adenine-N6)-dimethyltransferase